MDFLGHLWHNGPNKLIIFLNNLEKKIMKFLLTFLILALSTSAHSRSLAPAHCNAQDFQAMTQVWLDMEISGFDDALFQKNIGVGGGDCETPYSLEKAAELNHKQNAPPPFCGVVFTLDPDNMKEQATWLLNQFKLNGTTYVTVGGFEMKVCSKVSTIGPNSGVNITN
jgi:hypothetical protein